MKFLGYLFRIPATVLWVVLLRPVAFTVAGFLGFCIGATIFLGMWVGQMYGLLSVAPWVKDEPVFLIAALAFTGVVANYSVRSIVDAIENGLGGRVTTTPSR